MIQYLDSTLQTLLARELSADIAKEDIYFDSPDSKFKPGTPAVNCFLYAVNENRELRSNEWVMEHRSDGSARQTPPPVRVDCSYLFTVWADDIKTEHRLLGELVKIFSTYPTIPEEVLDEKLLAQQDSLPAITLKSGQIENISEFWQALGNKPKPALSYAATINVMIHEPEEVLLVKEKIINLHVEKEIVR